MLCCSLTQIYDVQRTVKVHTNTGLHEVVKRVKCLYVASCWSKQFSPTSSSGETFNTIPFSTYWNGRQKLCVCVCVYWCRLWTDCVSVTQRGRKSGHSIRDFLPQLQLNTESMRFCLPAPCCVNKEKSHVVVIASCQSFQGTKLPRHG